MVRLRSLRSLLPGASLALVPALALVLAVAPARADVVTLTSGGRVTGKIIEDSETQVRIKTDKGPILTIPRDEVDSITREKPEDTYARRAKGVKDDDVKGLLALAQVAKDLGLASRAEENWEKVLKVEPKNVDALVALGFEKVGDKWLRGDDLKKAKGLVEYQGRWISAEDKQCLEQGLVKRGDRWLTREEADASDHADAEAAKDPNEVPAASATSPDKPDKADAGEKPEAGSKKPPAEPAEPRKPADPKPAAEPRKPSDPKPAEPKKPGEPKKPAAPPQDLPEGDKELVKLLGKSNPDERRLDALRALATKGEGPKEAARAELLRQVDAQKKEVADYLKKDKAAIRARMAALIVERRATALAFIMDPKKYPEENHGAVAQPEVDKLVGALRRAWQDPLRELRAQNDKKISACLDELKKLAGWLKGELGDATDYEKLEDDLAFESDRVVQSSQCPVDGADAQILEKSLAIMKQNAAAPTSLTAEERQCLLATNEYRIMFGLLALKTFEPLNQAARKHSKEMVDLKYFSHDSPRPENASAGARCSREGAHCTGENIAMGSTSGRATFHQWYTSSGHHRNILTRSHRSIGIGAHENYWTQDFGADDP